MVINVERLLSHRFEDLRQTYTPRDAIIYALGIGLGRAPSDEADLDYLLETRLKVLPAFAGTLASPGMWMRDPAFGVDFARLVHMRQEASFHAPLPPSATVRATPKIAGLYDRGAAKGAVLVVERELYDETSHVPLATIRQTLLLRGDGGFGGEPPPASNITSPPLREADHRVEFATSPRSALIYRLSGDYNPLHADPASATDAGFDRPILHGLATYGVAAHVLERVVGRPLKRLTCSFNGVVYPGDLLTLSFWKTAEAYVFAGAVGERRVLGHGSAVFS